MVRIKLKRHWRPRGKRKVSRTLLKKMKILRVNYGWSIQDIALITGFSLEQTRQNLSYIKLYGTNGTCRTINRISHINRDIGRNEATRSETKKLIKQGIIIKQTECENCHKQSEVIECHHLNYLDPTKIKWLCPTCHKEVHNDRRLDELF